VLALAAIDGAGAVLFGLVYAAAGAHLLTQGAFVVALAVAFGAITATWMHVERSGGRHRDALSRLGRATGALALTLFAVPAVVLMPLFVLREGLPAEANVDALLRPIMVLLLISLSLVALVNLVGGGLVVAAALLRRLRAPRPS